MKVVENIIILLLTGIVIACLFALPVKWTWNEIMPYLFGLPKLNFYQALMLSLLFRFLIPTSSSSSNS